MVQDTLIGIDVGTTAVKALLISADGGQLARFSQDYPAARAGGGVVEQDPEDWVALVLAALSGFTADFDLAGLRGIGICSQVNTHVFFGAAGRALAPAIVWQDTRCAAIAAELDATIDDAARLAWWGAPMAVDASHGLARMAWMRRHRPEVWDATRWVMSPKDYCILRLTGQAVADPIASVGLVDGGLGYIQPLLDLVPGASSRLPPLHRFTAPAGRISSGLPCAGIGVVVGAMDAWSGMFGVGVSRPGDAMYLSGTSEILGLVSPDRVPEPGIIAFPAYDGITLHAGPTQSGGASMTWLGSLLGRSVEDLCVLGASVPDGEPVPLFLPHLQGERAPLWDAAARGVFIGLEATTGPAHLARAVMEGVAYSARLSLEALERSGNRPVTILHCGGGGFGSDRWNQIRADVLARSLKRIATPEAGALGAAAMAAIGSGVHATMGQSLAAMVRFDRSYEPDRARIAAHDFGFGLYRDAYEATRRLSHAFTSYHGAVRR